MPQNEFDGFAPQFASVVTVHLKNLKDPQIEKSLAAGQVDTGTSLITLDPVAKDAVNNSNILDRHYTVACSGVVSAFLPLDRTDSTDFDHLRRLCQHSEAETAPHPFTGELVQCAWFQVQICGRTFDSTAQAAACEQQSSDGI